METRKKIKMLNSVIEASEITEDELQLWWKLRQATPSFRIAYKKGNNFELHYEFIQERIDEIWGFEIIPGIILAKKTGPDHNVETTTWDNVKNFAENCILEGKKGSLPSLKEIKDKWTEMLTFEIQSMDKYLCLNEVDGETKSKKDPDFVGVVWCQEECSNNNAFYFDLEDNYLEFVEKDCCYCHDRIAISFV